MARSACRARHISSGVASEAMRSSNGRNAGPFLGPVEARRRLDVVVGEVPMELVARGDVRSGDVERATRAIERLEGAGGHRRDHGDVAAFLGSLPLLRKLL